MDYKPLVKGLITNFSIFLDVFDFFCVLDIFSVKKKEFWGILGLPYCDIGATIRIGREVLCLPYADFKKIMSQLISNEVDRG